MSAGSEMFEDSVEVKRVQLGEHRKASTDILMSLLAHKKGLSESGLTEEDPDVVEIIDGEIQSFKDGLNHFSNSSQGI